MNQRRVKIRLNNSTDAVCDICRCKWDAALNFFDLAIGKKVLVICDVCNGQFLEASLKAEVHKNSRTKSPRDMAVIRRRRWGK